jgi:muramoyltetrapeptide carboxypeptidase LdcA involved in peptidoglycan recycling
MQKIIPQKLQKGDKVMVVASSRGLKLISQETRDIAIERFREMGLTVEFAPNTNDENFDIVGSTSIEKRVEDLMYAFNDKSVKAIFTVIGGFNVNQIISHLDYEVIKENPKIISGFSDITALLGAINAKTGLEVYYGPHFSSLGMKKGCEYTLDYLKKILFSDDKINIEPAQEWSDDTWFLDQENRDFISNEGYWIIHNGDAKGKIIGGNLCTFNLLLGTKYRPSFDEDTILFIEDDEMTYTQEFDRDLQALCYQEDFKNVKALIIGRFQKKSAITREKLEFIINNKPELKNIPVIANVDFGHTTPIMTIPLGGYAELKDGKLNIMK